MTINGMTINGGSIDGDAALDEEAYQLWLRDPNSTVAYIARINYHGNSATYPNWITYTLYTSDTALPGTGYVGRIKSISSFQRQIGAELFGAVATTYGAIEFHNEDGALDLWPNLAVDGQLVEVLRGDPAWAVNGDVSRFRLFFRCVSEKFSSSTADTLTLQTRGIDYKSDQPIQTNLITTTTNNSTSNLPIPLGYGNVFNATPAPVDTTNQVYQCNDGAITSMSDCRDGGVRFQTAQIAISAVAGNLISTAAAHGFVANTRVRFDIGSFPTAANYFANATDGRNIVVLGYNTAVGAISSDGVKWTQTVLPVVANWYSCCWTGTLYVAVAYGSSIVITSPDGVNWTQRALPASANWCSVAWNGTILLAISYGSTSSATSADGGVTWTARTITSLQWGQLAVLNGLFCTTDGSNNVAGITSDGISWSINSMPASCGGGGLAANGLFFCSVSAGGVCATSSDGISWVAGTPLSGRLGYGVAWNGRVFVNAGESSTVVSTSPDGAIWTDRTLPATAFWAAPIFNGTVICLPGSSGYVTTSADDGVTWTPVSGSLPTPLAASTDYWVSTSGLTTTAFKLSATRGGAVIALTNTTTGASVIGYHWTADLTTGKIYLDQKLAGVLTVDFVAGSTDAATIVISALGAADVDPVSKLHFQATCSQPVGIYVAERRNRIDVAADVLSGLGAWYSRSREGMMQFGRIEGNPATYDAELNAEDLIGPFSFVLDEIIPPKKMHRLAYRKNWTKQDTVFAGASADNRALYAGDYSASLPIAGTDTGATGSFHALAQKPDVIPSMLTYSSDAQTEAARRNAMYFGWGAIFSCDAGLIGGSFDPGMVLKVTHPRFGLSGGVNMTVILTDDQPTNKTTKLRLFVALATYAPGQL